MNYEKNYRELESTYYMPAFSRDLMLVKGSGCNVTDAEGKTYLDLVAGIAVCSSGHCHPKVVQAIQKQAAGHPLFKPLLCPSPGNTCENGWLSIQD